ncbi:MAG: type II toxin-antitoxin system HicB family antitoxin [Pirellulales bacterium]
MMEYKGYLGKVDFDDDAEIFYGEVVNTRDVVTFQGESVTELTQAFRDSIDDYLAFCNQRGETPDKPFSGRFVTRVSPELHRQAHMTAALAGKSLNAFVTEQLQAAVQHRAGRQATMEKATLKKARTQKSSSKSSKTGKSKRSL